MVLKFLWVTKPQAVIRPTTGFNPNPAKEQAETSYKTASGNQAYNPVARTRLTERA